MEKETSSCLASVVAVLAALSFCCPSIAVASTSSNTTVSLSEGQAHSSLDSQYASSGPLDSEYVAASIPSSDTSMVGIVPYFMQDGQNCGLFSMMQVLWWFGRTDVTARDIGNYLGHQDGPHYIGELEDAFYHFLGSGATTYSGGFTSGSDAAAWVKHMINGLVPVMACIKAPDTVTIGWANHYVTIVGYDTTGWYIHDTGGFFDPLWDCHVSYGEFDEMWNRVCNGLLTVRGVVTGYPYMGDGNLAKADVYIAGSVPDFYDSRWEDPFTVDIWMTNVGADSARYCELRIDVRNADIIGVWNTASLDDWIALNSSGWVYTLPAYAIVFRYVGSTPMPPGGNPNLHVTLTLMPKMIVTYPDHYLNGWIYVSGHMEDSDDRGRTGKLFVDDDSDRDRGNGGVYGVVMPCLEQMIGSDNWNEDYGIFDDDVDSPIIHHFTYDMPNPVYDGYNDVLLFCVVTSDASDIDVNSAMFSYGFSKTGYVSPWLPPHDCSNDLADPHRWSIWFVVPHEAWINHVGEYCLWSAKVADLDIDMDSREDQAWAYVRNNTTPSVYVDDDDWNGPTISLPATSFEYEPASGCYKIWADVTDLSGVSQVRMRYRFTDTVFSDWKAGTTGDGRLYSVSIPRDAWEPHKTHQGDSVYWQVDAWDNDNDWERINDCSYTIAEPFSSVFVPPDSSPPSTSSTLTGTFGLSGWYVSAVTLELQATDEMSGVSATMYRIDAGPWSVYSGSLTVSEDGSHTIEYYSRDVAGNSETVVQKVFMIDATEPSLSVSGNIENWQNSTVVVSWTATDTISDVDHYAYSIDGGVFKNVGMATTLTPTDLSDGKHSLVVRAVDKAGNNADVPVVLKIDRADPTLTLSDDLKDKYAVNNVTVRWEASDATSGIDHCEYSVDGAAFVNVGVASEATLVNLSDGTHNVVLRASDKAGNIAEFTVVLIIDSSAGTAGSDGHTDPLNLISISVLVAAIVGAASALILKRKGRMKN